MPGQPFTSFRNPNGKLTGEQVLSMRNRYAAGESQGSLARDFGVSVGTVGRIVRGESWQGTKANASARPSTLPPTEDEIRESGERLLAKLGEEKPAARPLPAYLAGIEDADEPVRYVPPVKSELSESDAAELVAKRAQSDQQLIARFVEATGIPLEEIQERYLACRGDRQAIGKLFNDLAHAPKREFITLKETLDD